MRTDLVKAYFNLPTVRNFILSLVDVLAERRSVIVLLPANVDVNLVKQAVWGELWSREFSMREISLREFPHLLPLDNLTAVFQPEWAPPDIPRTLANFMEITHLPDVIGLWSIDACTNEIRSKWMQLIRDWAALCHQRANNGKQTTAFCLIAHAENSLGSIPENDIFLEVRWWWGFPSILENSLLCRQGSGNSRNPLDQWREKLLPSLAGGDLQLIDYLWDRIGDSLDDLITSLENFQLEANWTNDDKLQWQSYLSANGDHRSHGAGLPPPRKILNQWARGLIYSTVEFGPEVHPAILARLRNFDDLKHRLWRGQTELVLPLVDGLRLEICSRLTQRLGVEWPWRWEIPDSEDELSAVKDNPKATQLGYLSWLIRKNQNFRNFRQWSILVFTAHQIRNEIAHYRIITIKDFERLLQEIDGMVDC